MRRPWESWEEEIAARATWGELPAVARELRRSVQSVTSKRYRLGVGPPKRKWSEAEDERLDHVVAEGGRVEDAALSLGRSRLAAYARRHALREAGAAVPVARCGERVYV